MAIFRSSRCSLAESNAKKLSQLGDVLSEYGRVVNIFIEFFLEHGRIGDAKWNSEVYFRCS